jgi:hypothetical protein
MKNIDLKSLRALSDKNFWRGVGNKLKLSLHELPKLLFVKHSHILDSIAIALVLVLAGYLVLTLFYLAPSDFNVESREQQKLTVSLLERIDTWIERRGQERQRVLQLSGDKLFERPKAVE